MSITQHCNCNHRAGNDVIPAHFARCDTIDSSMWKCLFRLSGKATRLRSWQQFRGQGWGIGSFRLAELLTTSTAGIVYCIFIFLKLTKSLTKFVQLAHRRPAKITSEIAKNLLLHSNYRYSSHSVSEKSTSGRRKTAAITAKALIMEMAKVQLQCPTSVERYVAR